MKRFNLANSGARGWFVGDFPEAVYRTKDFEVNYQVNEARHSRSHYHKDVTEITLVITGSMLMNGEIFKPGDIIYLDPGEIAQLEYLEPTTTVTVKTPSVPSDKQYL
jgi:mannose/fructose/N-acetylgalactosamine-specific phosphotransferase system component IIB